MPENARATPNFDTYPAPSPGPTARPDRQLPEDPTGARLTETAETIGTAVGKAVNTVRDLPGRLEDMKDDMKHRLQVVRRQGGPSAGDKLKDKADELKDKAGELKQQASDKLGEARQRASRMANESPLTVVLAAGIVAFAVGVILRVWRSNRGY
jgi:hypothetical protein